MGYAKERGKLEKLSTKVSTIKNYDDKSLASITDIYEQYSHSVRILKNKNTTAFSGLYQTDLEEVKLAKRALKESEEAEREDNFSNYKKVLLDALKNAIKTTKEAT